MSTSEFLFPHSGACPFITKPLPSVTISLLWAARCSKPGQPVTSHRTDVHINTAALVNKDCRTGAWHTAIFTLKQLNFFFFWILPKLLTSCDLALKPT